MESNDAQEMARSFSRRTAIGFGVASGLALASFPTEDLFGKPSPDPADMNPHLAAAWKFAIKGSLKCGNGYWAVSYSEDKFAGDPLLFTTPELMQKSQAGTMPDGWGAKAGSIVVGPSAVLRLIHKVNDQDTHITLLPCEMMADMSTAGVTDGAYSWKLFPSSRLGPPY